MAEHIIKFVRLKPEAIVPEYQTEHAAAMDIHACLDKPITIAPMERMMIPSGFAMEIPIGYEAQIRARSGLSIKHGITMVNGVGTIDADYRGEVGVLIINLGTESFTIEPAMRIAQMLIAKYEHITWEEVQALSVTERGAGGFGSTGTDHKG
jgi:dUTP pyrophosphatase